MKKVISKIVDGKRVHEKVALTQSEIDAIEASKPTLEQLKNEALSRANSKAYQLLSKTDWYIIRMVDKEIEVPLSVINERDGIRTRFDSYETEVNACETIEALQALGEFE
jgi:hypothetical protein